MMIGYQKVVLTVFKLPHFSIFFIMLMEFPKLTVFLEKLMRIHIGVNEVGPFNTACLFMRITVVSQDHTIVLQVGVFY